MPFPSTLGIVAFATLAGSYGWGMRGCKIGGEKGAMLPGAFLGLIFAWFSGSDIIRENFWIFSAVGALAMFFGGTETYGETLGFIIKSKPSENYAKGMVGVLIKGALWFGIFGAFIGIAFNAMTGTVYKWQDFVIFFALLVPLRFVGILLFNRPVKPEQNKFPKFYFSKTRKESWGGLLVLLIMLIVLMAVRGDTYSLMFSGAGALSGAIGWALGINLFYLTCQPLKSGKYFFGSWQTKGYIGSWKIMEFTLGAVGGLGTSFYFCLNYAKLQSIIGVIDIKGALWNPLGDKQNAAALISLVLILLTGFQYLFQSTHQKNVKPKSKTDYLGLLFEGLEQPFYSYIPLVFILLGGVRTAQIVSFFALFWVIAEMDFFERFIKTKARWFWFVVFIGGCVAILAGELFLPSSYTAWQTWLLYCVAYEFFELCWIIHVGRENVEAGDEKKPFYQRMRRLSEPLVHGYFLLQIAALLLIGFFVFR